MDSKIKEKVDKKLRDGWIRSSMMIEVLGTTEKAANLGLDQHMKKMEKEDKCIIYNRNLSEIQKAKHPHPKVKLGYSKVIEFEIVTEDFETLIYLVMAYGPSSVEIHEPEKINMHFGEAQSIVNSLAEMIHRYAAAGLGGIMINATD